MGIVELYYTVLRDPILNLLVWLVDVLPGHELGVAIILVTLVIRLAMWPLSAKSFKAQRRLQELQPEITKIRERYKDDKQKQSQKLMEVYQKHNMNPLSSCFPLLIQMPIIFALYSVFRLELNEETFGLLYSFVPTPEQFSTNFFGLVDLTAPSIVLAALAAIGQFGQAYFLLKRRKKQHGGKEQLSFLSSIRKLKEDAQKGAKDGTATQPDPTDLATSMTRNMTYIMPIMTFVIALGLPSALALYWFVSTIVAVLQQIMIFREPTDSDTDTINTKAKEVKKAAA